MEAPSVDDPQGAFEIKDVVPGIATLQIKAPKYAAYQENLTIEPRQITRADILLAPEGVLEGVISLDSVPKKASVELFSADGSTTFRADIDDAGRYILNELPAGQFLFRAATSITSSPAGYRSESTTAIVQAGKINRLDVNISYGNGGIHGLLQFPSEYAMGTVEVRDANAIADGKLESKSSLGGTGIKTSGPYEVNGLQPGKYIIVATARGRSDQKLETKSVSETVTIAEGEKLEINIEIE